MNPDPHSGRELDVLALNLGEFCDYAGGVVPRRSVDRDVNLHWYGDSGLSWHGQEEATLGTDL